MRTRLAVVRPHETPAPRSARPVPVPGRTFRLRLCIGLIAGSEVSAAALAGPALQPVSVPTRAGLATYHARDLNAASTPASLLVGGGSSKVPARLEPGHELTNLVIVRTDTPQRVPALRGLTREPASAAGYTLVRTRSVKEAAALAKKLRNAPGVLEAYVDSASPVSLRDIPDDPFLQIQWNLRNLQDPGIDANVLPAWEAGYSGLGVIVGIVEPNNVQFAHPDLEMNFNASASVVDRPFHQHPTAVAGIIAMVGSNNLGGAGSAFEAQFSTISTGTASKTADAFNFRNDLNDIKSNSWGPPDNGRLGRITTIERDALRQSVQTGRAGLGEVFVWAAGNGGLRSDERMDYDPFASSRYTIAVGAFNDAGVWSEYNERGSSIVLVAPSDGGFNSPENRGIYSTDLIGSPGFDPGDFTTDFGGTSAAAPIAAGVIALLLQANPDLTWRDVQHVLINAARPIDPSDPGWEPNGAGRLVHERYGFGALDAGNAVEIAQTWRNVGPELLASSGVIAPNIAIPDNNPQGITLSVEIPEEFPVETVELVLNIPGTFAGDLDIRLTSPSGFETVFAEQRDGDFTAGYTDWIFTSFRHWSESSLGTWTISISDRSAGDLHTLANYELRVFGADLPLCPADISGASDPNDPRYDDPDGDADADDFFRYLDLFAAGDPRADLTGSNDPGDPSFGVPDGSVDADDFFFYIDLFAQGCR